MPSETTPYVIIVTIPKNTTSDTKINTGDINISGRIVHMIIDIPAGWDASSGVRLETRKSRFPQAVPNVSKYFTGDDINLDLHPHSDVYEDKLDIYGINNDTLNDHTCVITLEVET